jgi:predicted DNA-binding transcriptional regulator AlpA
MRVELQSAMQLAATLPAERLPEFIGELESVKVVALARIAPAKDEDRTIDAQTAADELGIARSTFYRNHKRKPYPFVSPEGGKLTASLEGLKRYQENKRK